MNRHAAPLEGCDCTVCNWANRRIERDRRLDKDLEANYALYEAGLLVSKDDKE
jgi:hypothetical protein